MDGNNQDISTSNKLYTYDDGDEKTLTHQSDAYLPKAILQMPYLRVEIKGSNL